MITCSAETLILAFMVGSVVGQLVNSLSILAVRAIKRKGD